jgi:hypothetical protein
MQAKANRKKKVLLYPWEIEYQLRTIHSFETGDYQDVKGINRGDIFKPQHAVFVKSPF